MDLSALNPMQRKAAETLSLRFKLIINGQSLL